MKKQRFGTIGTSLSLLALVLYASVLWAEPPLHEVHLESYSTPNWTTGLWEGDGTVYIDGVKYEGTFLHSADGESNKNGWHGTETQVFDVPGLGTIELAGTTKTVFAYVSPMYAGKGHRWHRYTSHLQITGGTGAFAAAQGEFHFGGFTEWFLDFTVTPPNPPMTAQAFEGAQAKVIGIQMP